MIRDIHFPMKRHRYERWVSSTSIFQCNSARLPNQTWKGSLRRWSNTPPSAFGFIAPRICAYQPFSDCIERCARDGRSHRPLRSCMRSGSLIRCGPSSSGRSLPEHVARSTAPNADDNRRAFSQRGGSTGRMVKAPLILSCRVLRTPYHVLSAKTARSVTTRTSMPARGTSYEVSGTSVYDNVVLNTTYFVRSA